MTTVSKFEASGRRKRVDAERSASVILDAAIVLLGERREAGMADVAVAAGVTRQTVYAHYPSRTELLAAVASRVNAEVITALGAVDLERGPADAALRRWLGACWRLIERYPVLLNPTAFAAGTGDQYESHQPITQGLVGLIERGRQARVFDRRLPVQWCVAAIISLGHTAAQELGAGRMNTRDAGRAFTESVLRVCRAEATGRSGSDVR